MNVTKLRVGVFLGVIALLILAACGGGSDETKSEPTAPPASGDAPTAVPTEAPAEEVAPTEPPASGGGEEGPAPTEAPEEPTPEPESEIPYDLAIMEGATNLDIQETSVSYRLEQTQIEEAVEFYETHMTEQGWESLSNSTIGLMATLVYESDQARVSVKLQANNFAETVDVTVLVFPK